MAAQRRQALMEAVTTNDEEKFLQIASDHRNKRVLFDLSEVLVELARSQLEELWESLLSWVTQLLPSLIPQDTDQDGEGPTRTDRLVLAILETAVCTVNGLSSSDTEEPNVPAGLLQTAVILNSMLLTLDEYPCLDPICERICYLSELWWSRQLPEREALAPTALTYLLQLAVASDKKPTKALVRRIACLRPCLRRLQLSAPSSARLRQMLAAVAQCPVLLSCDEGIRMLSELLHMPPLMDSVHASIKAVLPTVTNQQAYRYGEVYYRAWRGSDQEGKQCLEERCIQDLMYHAVHADRSVSRLWRLLYQLLHFLHGQRRHRETAVMVADLYQPILWRALTSPNEMIQLNATFILFDVFPVVDPTESREARDAGVQKQCQTMINLLTETSHHVRAAAAKGVCKVLTQYWELIPADALKQMMKLMLKDLAYDASSAEVRQQVVNSLGQVLDNPYTHEYMKSVLPFLADTFHDVNLPVRVATCDLLLKLKPLKTIRYFDVVPVKHLLARLAVDEPPVCRRIVQLMINSFFPVTESDETVLSRCICLIQENREASRRFYQHSGKVLDIENAVRLMIAIRQALTIHVRKVQQQQQHRRGSGARAGPSQPEDKENRANDSRRGKRRLHNVEDRSVLSDASQESESSADESESQRWERSQQQQQQQHSPLEKQQVLAGLVDVVAVLWTTRLPELADRPDLHDQLQQPWARVLPLLFNHYKDTAAGRSLLYVASLLPHGLMSPVSSHCLSVLRQLPDEAATDPATYAYLLDALINWGRTDDIIELCTECLQAALDGERSFVASTKNARRSAAGGVRFRDPRRPRPRPRLALRWLTHLLTPSMRRSCLVSRHGQQLAELHSWLSCAKSVVEEQLRSGDDSRDGLTVELLRTYLLFSLVLATGERRLAADTVSGLLQDIDWAVRLVTEDTAWTNVRLLATVCKTITQVLVNTSLVGVLTPPLAVSMSRWMLHHLSSNAADTSLCLTVLFHAVDVANLATCRPPEELPDWQEVYTRTVPQLVGSALGRLTALESGADTQLAAAQLTEVTSLVRSLVTALRRAGGSALPALSDLVALVIACCTANVTDVWLKGSTESPVTQLPPLGASLMAPLLRDDQCCRLVAEHVARISETCRQQDVTDRAAGQEGNLSGRQDSEPSGGQAGRDSSVPGGQDSELPDGQSGRDGSVSGRRDSELSGRDGSMSGRRDSELSGRDGSVSGRRDSELSGRDGSVSGRRDSELSGRDGSMSTGQAGQDVNMSSQQDQPDPAEVLSLVVTSAYVLKALTAVRVTAPSFCGPAVSAALAAADRITGLQQLSGDDAPRQHLSAAARLLRELRAQLPTS